MAKKSAGILLYRLKKGSPEVLLVHPGGPFFIRKDEGVWSIPKGEYEESEAPLSAAKREFFEETGFKAEGDFIALTPVRLKSGKVITAFALMHDIDASLIKSNSFEIEWPPKSGNTKSFPEIDRGAWFDVEMAKKKINPAQALFIEEVQALLHL